MKLTDTNRYYLQTPATPKRWLHLATVHDSVREFICFADRLTNQIYIEEITGGHLEMIEDDKLAEGLHEFLVYHRVLNMNRPLISDDEWLRNKNTI